MTQSLVGLQLSHYRLSKLLAKGGMGEVYLADDLHIRRQVAIKVLHVENDYSTFPQENLNRSRREAQVLTRLDHPHIVHLLDYGESVIEGVTSTYIVMPLFQEGSLATLLQRRKGIPPFSPEEVATLVRQAAEALQYAHDRDIIHRDVKPANFLLRSQKDAILPDLFLTDFGIASINRPTATTSVNGLIGTYAYMAPEQWDGHAPKETDQYALAVMIYQLVTGRLPFQAEKLFQLMNQHKHVQPLPPSYWNANLSTKIDAVLLKALAKKPEDRYPSVTAFAQAFQDAVSKKPSASVFKASTKGPRLQLPVSVLQVFILLLSIAGILLYLSPYYPSSADSYGNFILAHGLMFAGLGVLLFCMLLACMQTLLLGKRVWSIGLLMLGPLAGIVYALIGSGPVGNIPLKQPPFVTRKRNVRSLFFRFLKNLGVVLLLVFELVIQVLLFGSLTLYSTSTLQHNAIANYFAQSEFNTPPIKVANSEQLHLVFFDPLNKSKIDFSVWDIPTFHNAPNETYRGDNGTTVSNSCLPYKSNSFNSFLNYPITANSFSNFVFDVHLNMNTNKEGGGIFFSGGEYGDCKTNSYVFYITQNGSYTFGSYDNTGNFTKIACQSTPVANTALGGDNSISIVAFNNQIHLYVNDKPICEHNNEYGLSKIGLYTAEGQVLYKNAGLWTWDNN